MTEHPQPPVPLTSLPRDIAGNWICYFIGPVFLVIAAWFLWGPKGLDIPAHRAMTVGASRIPTTPRRDMLGDPPVINIDGFDRTCMDCHRMFPPRLDTPVRLLKHQDIILDHGINDRCRNCHYDEDRNKLVLRGGAVIGYDEVAQLCAKCHGPTYHDWERGAHGRTNGYWDTSRGAMIRLQCTQCHDPHNPRVPAMDPLWPLPGPNTLRMGAPEDTARRAATHVRDPLRRAFGKEDAD